MWEAGHVHGRASPYRISWMSLLGFWFCFGLSQSVSLFAKRVGKSIRTQTATTRVATDGMTSAVAKAACKAALMI